ncbi:MAG TPA: hypothetical protein DCP91_05715 [Eggerthellaceae bacterium]|nr:hypothetical protein [Eggerthellaceae bacterium]
MDVAATLVNYLDGATDIQWYHNAPKNSPAEFGTLTRDGGPSEIVRELPTVTLIVYASTRGRAATLAEQAKNALLMAQYEVPSMFGCEILGDYYDPLDGKHRHRITASLIMND